MKRKTLALILAVSMMLSQASIEVFAQDSIILTDYSDEDEAQYEENDAEVDITEFEDLELAIGAETEIEKEIILDNYVEPETVNETKVIAVTEAVETEVIAETETALETEAITETATETEMSTETEATVETEVSEETEVIIETEAIAETEMITESITSESELEILLTEDETDRDLEADVSMNAVNVNGIDISAEYFEETAVIATAGNTLTHCFTPRTGGYYRIKSEGSMDTYVSLYDENMSLIVSDDDGGYACNFQLIYNFSAGTTYYIGMRFYSSSVTGSFAFELARECEISYNANGGMGEPESDYGYYGETITITDSIPTRSGYVFNGWYTAATGGSRVSGSLTLNDDQMLYAQWIRERPVVDEIVHTDSTFNLTFSTSGTSRWYLFSPYSSGNYRFTSEGALDTYVTLYDADMTELSHNDDGGSGNNFLLDYYCTSGGEYIIEVKPYGSYTGSTCFKVKKEYTLSYNANGGTGAPEGQSAFYGDSVQISGTTPTRSGYAFNGWYTAPTGGSCVSGSITIEGDQILYAHWRDTVIGNATAGSSYNLSFGEGEMKRYLFTPSVSGTYRITSEGSTDTYVYLYDADMTQIGYNDDGGSGNNFLLDYYCTAGQRYYITVKLYSSSATGTTCLKIIKGNTLTYDANGGTDAPEAQKIFNNGTADISDIVPVRNGYSFEGWYTSANGGSCVSGSISLTDDKTVYAHWNKLIDLYLTGSYIDTVDFADTSDEKLIAFTPASGGIYRLESSGNMDPKVYIWDSNKQALASNDDGGEGRNFQLDYTFQGNTTYYLRITLYSQSATGNMGLKIREKHTVTYNPNGGTGGPGSGTCYYGDSYTLSTVKPTKAGYGFDGWYTARQGGTKVSGSMTVRNNVTLYARWKNALGKVELVSAQAVSGGIKVTWKPTAGAQTYVVYRKVAGESWTPMITTVTGLNWTDTTAVPGISYIYTVKAQNGTDRSLTHDSTGVTATVPLAKVKLNSVAVVSGGIKINWQTTAGALNYVVYRKTADTGWKQLTDSATGSSWIDKTAVPAVKYTYTVKARRGTVRSTSFDATGISAMVPLAEVVLKSAEAVSGGIRVNWQAAAGAKTYVVYRKTATTSWTALTSSATGSSWIDKTAVPAVKYTYTVRAVSGTQKSATYNKTGVSATLPLPTVSLISAQKVTNGIKVSWNAAKGAKTYRVYRRVAGGSWATIASSVTGTSWIDTSAKVGVTYYYTVKAMSGSLLSPSYDKTGVSAKR